MGIYSHSGSQGKRDIQLPWLGIYPGHRRHHLPGYDNMAPEDSLGHLPLEPVAGRRIASPGRLGATGSYPR